MQPNQYDERAILGIARRISDSEARSEYLLQVCGEDKERIERIEQYIAASEDSTSFLEPPGANVRATIDPPVSDERPGTRVGPYKLIEELGDGGMGLVYLASQREPVRR